MPIKDEREYRAMPLLTPTDGEKRFDTDFYVEGYATTFDEPYVLFEYDGIQYKEVVHSEAFDEADLTDVIMQYDHNGRVYARNKMGKGKAPTLFIQPDPKGLFTAADLGLTEESKKMHDEIDKGLIYQMSWCFVVREESFDIDTHTRHILKIKKVYDVSAVSIPANNQTEIVNRSHFDGVIEMEKMLEQQARTVKVNELKRATLKAQLNQKVRIK